MQIWWPKTDFVTLQCLRTKKLINLIFRNKIPKSMIVNINRYMLSATITSNHRKSKWFVRSHCEVAWCPRPLLTYNTPKTIYLYFVVCLLIQRYLYTNLYYTDHLLTDSLTNFYYINCHVLPTFSQLPFIRLPRNVTLEKVF